MKLLKLTKKEIDAVLKSRNRARWGKYLDVYEYLIKNLKDSHRFQDYERKFNYFYQVRRNSAWRREFYKIFYKLKNESIGGQARGKRGGSRGNPRETLFPRVIHEIWRKTGKIEASFASKLVAIIDAELPVIDRHVLSYIGAKLPPSKLGARNRLSLISELHGLMKKEFSAFLKSPEGKYLIKRFREEFPDRKVGEMKALDFILWLSGGRGKVGGGKSNRKNNKKNNRKNKEGGVNDKKNRRGARRSRSGFLEGPGSLRTRSRSMANSK